MESEVSIGNGFLGGKSFFSGSPTHSPSPGSPRPGSSPPTGRGSPLWNQQTLDPSYAPKVLRGNSCLTRVESETGTEVKVLVIYTGGTIGMGPSDAGYVCQSHVLEQTIAKFPQLNDDEYAEKHYGQSQKKPLVLPPTGETFRVLYSVFEYEPLLDSSNMTMDDWIRIALDIRRHYEKFDGFVILHGTDTMAYTASALSFMLENLGKTVVITGSQIPLFEPRSDGRDNLLNSLIIAGNYSIPEVTVLFNNKLFRGNRTSKVSATSLDAFDSPNMAPLARIGIKIQVDWANVFRSPNIERFSVHSTLSRNVGLLRLFPSITVEVVRAFLTPPVQGVVLQTYGSGNGPSNRRDILDELKRASQRGVIVINCTQCATGKVEPSYETGFGHDTRGSPDQTELRLEQERMVAGHQTPHDADKYQRRIDHQQRRQIGRPRLDHGSHENYEVIFFRRDQRPEGRLVPCYPLHTSIERGPGEAGDNEAVRGILISLRLRLQDAIACRHFVGLAAVPRYIVIVLSCLRNE